MKSKGENDSGTHTEARLYRRFVPIRPTPLVIFAPPKSGTPVMIASPSIALDLPLKALAWEDGQGKVWLSANAPEYLKERHLLRMNCSTTSRG